MGFFMDYGGGFGGLAAKYLPTRDTRRVVADFVRGRRRIGSCQPPNPARGRGRVCHAMTDGLALKIDGFEVARRSAPNVDTIKVCVPPAGGSQKQRLVANAVLRSAKAGVSVREIKGSLRFSGRKGRAHVILPDRCMTVHVGRKLRERAADNIMKSLAADYAGRRPMVKVRKK